MTEKLIKSNEARIHFREIIDHAGEGVFTGIGRWKDPPAVWVVSDEWFQRAQACLGEVASGRPRQASEALHHFREVLDDATRNGVFTSVSRWNGETEAWFVSDDWYQGAKARLGEEPAARPAHIPEQGDD